MSKEQQDRVREYIQNGLETGELSAGQRLPAERELAERLGTSRATVRQALDVLEARRQVTRHVGRGTFIARAGTLADRAADEGELASAAAAPPDGVEVSPAELIQARLLFEPHVAALVVLNGTESDVRNLRRITEAQPGMSGSSFEESDILFHRVLARSTHNELVVAMADLLGRARKHPEWTKLKDVVARRNGGPRPGAATEHLAVVVAIEARDAEEAASSMRRHLENVRRNLLEP